MHPSGNSQARDSSALLRYPGGSEAPVSTASVPQHSYFGIGKWSRASWRFAGRLVREHKPSAECAGNLRCGSDVALERRVETGHPAHSGIASPVTPTPALPPLVFRWQPTLWSVTGGLEQIGRAHV